MTVVTKVTAYWLRGYNDGQRYWGFFFCGDKTKLERFTEDDYIYAFRVQVPVFVVSPNWRSNLTSITWKRWLFSSSTLPFLMRFVPQFLRRLRGRSRSRSCSRSCSRSVAALCCFGDLRRKLQVSSAPKGGVDAQMALVAFQGRIRSKRGLWWDDEDASPLRFGEMASL